MGFNMDFVCLQQSLGFVCIPSRCRCTKTALYYDKYFATHVSPHSPPPPQPNVAQWNVGGTAGPLHITILPTARCLRQIVENVGACVAWCNTILLVSWSRLSHPHEDSPNLEADTMLQLTLCAYELQTKYLRVGHIISLDAASKLRSHNAMRVFPRNMKTHIPHTVGSPLAQ